MSAASGAAGHPRPRGKTPNGCYWDPFHEPCGHWRRTSDDELHDTTAAEQRRNAGRRHTTADERRRKANGAAARFAAAARGRRNTRLNAARCNDVLFKPGFNLATVERVNVGRLGDKTCCHCDALLYEGEATKKSKMKPGEWRGCSCCGQRRCCRDRFWCAGNGWQPPASIRLLLVVVWDLILTRQRQQSSDVGRELLVAYRR